MIKKLVLNPHGWPCTLEDCPPGHFLHENIVGFKSEYRTAQHKIEAYCDSGEFFCRDENTIVQPLTASWEEFEY